MTMSLFKKSIMMLAFLALSAMSAHASATAVYIGQNAVGTANGADCPDAIAVSYLNNPGNWVPGATFHLCGVFNFPAGAAGITALGSGTSTSPIIIQFENNAILQSPFFGGSNPSGGCSGATSCPAGISISGFHDIVIDGGLTGTIQNTANGTNLAYQQQSIGIYISGSDVIVRNLTITNIYVNNGSVSGATDTSGQPTADIRIGYGSTNISICNNVIASARGGIWSDTAGGGNQNTNCQSNTFTPGVNYFLNTLYDHDWQIVVSGSGAPNVYSNDISGYTNWNFPSNTYHLDGIFVSGDGNSVISPYIYNNYLHSSMNPTGGGEATGYIYCTEQFQVTGGAACTIFNNVFDMPAIFNASPITLDNEDVGPHLIYNNTFSGAGNVAAATIEVYNNSNQASGGPPSVDVRNNVGINGGGVWVVHEEGWYAYSISNFDHNDWDLGSYSGTAFDYKTSVGGMTLAAWQGLGMDMHSSFVNPALTTTNCANSPSTCYQLSSSSAARNIGQNLTSLCTGPLAPLCYDKPVMVGQGGMIDGKLRPTNGNWDAGAYEFSSVSAPAPPSRLAATVQ
jgi:hypothetical protein